MWARRRLLSGGNGRIPEPPTHRPARVPRSTFSLPACWKGSRCGIPGSVRRQRSDRCRSPRARRSLGGGGPLFALAKRDAPFIAPYSVLPGRFSRHFFRSGADIPAVSAQWGRHSVCCGRGPHIRQTGFRPTGRLHARHACSGTTGSVGRRSSSPRRISMSAGASIPSGRGRPPVSLPLQRSNRPARFACSRLDNAKMKTSVCPKNGTV